MATKQPKSPEAVRLGALIKAARLRAGISSQAQLADACGWKNADGDPAQGRVSNYETGTREPGMEEIRTIARVTEKPLSYFYKGLQDETIEHNISEGPPISAKKVPLISFVMAGDMCDAEDPYPTGSANDWVDVSIPVTDGMYALRVEGESMINPHGTPSFTPGMLIIVDPTARAENGSLVIARDGAGKATFKKLMFDGDQSFLVPLNPRYNPIIIEHELHICGVVVAAQIDLR